MLVAEDPHTGRIVGLVCMAASVDDQSSVIKHFVTEPYHKMQHLSQDTNTIDKQYPHLNSFVIHFFFLHPDYTSRAVDFPKPCFLQFPFAEYALIRLPHAIHDHALLQRFNYLPLKQGLSLKQGCFILCRYVLEPLGVRSVQPPDLEALRNLLMTQHETKKSTCDYLMNTLGSLSARGDAGPGVRPARARDASELRKDGPLGDHEGVVVLHHKVVVGAMVLRRITPEEVMDDLISKYNVEDRIQFYPAQPKELSATPIGDGSGVHVAEGRSQALSWIQDMPGLMIESFYIRTFFSSSVRFILREVLRLTGRLLP